MDVKETKDKVKAQLMSFVSNIRHDQAKPALEDLKAAMALKQQLRDIEIADKMLKKQ